MHPAISPYSRLNTFKALIFLTGVIAMCAGTAARAQSSEPLRVLTDTLITQSLVSMVMGDTGQPEVLLQGSASPHDYSLRPSDAQRLASADVLFWTSRNLTIWLNRILNHSDAGTTPAESLELMTSPGTITHSFRSSHIFEHDHDVENAGENEEHEHDAHENKPSGQSHNEHNAKVVDPHGWLDPVNAADWVGVIAIKLGELDPDNAQIYNKNAIAARLRINELQQTITQQMASVPQRQFVVFHDSFQYFENRFNVFASAAIALGDANIPGIREMNELREELRLHENACLFSEPQFNDKLMQSLSRGLDRPIGILDPLGANQTPGPDLYVNVMEQIAGALKDCSDV